MANQLTRRGWLRLVGAGALSALTTACQAEGGARPTPTLLADGSTAKAGGTAGLTLALANSELAVGPNRFALAVLEAGRSIPNAAVRFEFFHVDGQSATKRGEAEATYRAIEESHKGLYVARTAFDQAGAWGVQVSVEQPGRTPAAGRVNFEVLHQGAAPMPGTPAIPSHNPKARDVSNLGDICSAQPPCSLHELSIAEALTQAKPAMVTFATPGYCTTQTCAPVLAEVQKVSLRRASQANFLHVEIYKDPRTLLVADTVREWNLRSEPWVFVLDRGGIISDRLESLTTADELDASLASLI
jgi:hypothetical protein